VNRRGEKTRSITPPGSRPRGAGRSLFHAPRLVALYRQQPGGVSRFGGFSLRLWSWAAFLVLHASMLNAAPVGNVMPYRYARPDTPVTVWGTLNRGTFDPPPAGAAYSWTFLHDDSVTVTLDAASSISGVITDCRNIAVTCTFSLQNGATSARVQAVLHVTTPDGDAHVSTWLDIVAHDDPRSNTPEKDLEIDRRIAIAKALRRLYLRQTANGSWPYTDAAACTATALWAFANAGHTPDRNADVYQPVVSAAVEYLLANSAYVPVAVTPRGDPDADGNGRGILLGKHALSAWRNVDGYSHAMCLIALCAAGVPDYVTHAGPFDNAGAGTPLQDIVQDAADFTSWKLGTNEKGGWNYSLTSERTRADLSISGWNYLALEAASSFGVVVPDWVAGWCEHLLQALYDEGRFGYSVPPEAPPTPATTGAGLAGLLFVSLDGRAPGLEAGSMAARVLATFGRDWVKFPDFFGSGLETAVHGDGYQMWTVARALRMAGVTHLNSPTGPFDWQRNITPPEDPHEGFWPFLIRTQRADGSWDGRPHGYNDEFTTAWAVLCLSEGVVGSKTILRDVEVTANLPGDVRNSIVPDSWAGPPPHIEDVNEEQRLSWFLGDMYAGQSFDLSFDQILDALEPGELRTVQNSLSVVCLSSEACPLEETRGPLAVAVDPSLYRLSVYADRDAYALGESARFTVNLTLPPGRAFQRITAPRAGRYVIAPDLAESAADWSTVDFDLLNPEDFAPGDAPVAIRARSAPTRDGLGAAAFSEPVTVTGSRIPCAPGRFLELDVALTPNAAGTLPRIGFITVWYNPAPARVLLDVVGPAGSSPAATPLAYSIFPDDYGRTIQRTSTWTVAGLPPNSPAAVRARLVDNDGAELAQAVDAFTVTAAAADSLDAAVSKDAPVYQPNAPATFTAFLRNRDAFRTLEELTVTLVVFDPQSNPTEDGHFTFAVHRLKPGETIVRRFVWNTADHAPGAWTLRQTVCAEDGTVLSSIVAPFEIVAGGDVRRSLAGTITVEPRTLTRPETFNATWTIENRGNTGYRNLTLELWLSSAPDQDRQHVPRGGDAVHRRIGGTTVPRIDRGSRISGAWTAIPSADLPEGSYIATLQIAQERGAPAVLDAAPLTVRDKPPDVTAPTTTHDYAFDDIWTNHDAHIHLTAVDNPGGSGVKQTSWTLNGATTAGAAITIAAEGVSTITFRSEDNAGNVEPDHTLTVKIDKTPPVVTPVLTPTPNANGWNNSDVTVMFQADDALSGVRSVTPPLTLTAEGAGQNVTGRADDVAGNTAATAVTVNIDKTPPMIEVTGVDDGQVTNQDVTPVVEVEEANPGATTITLDGRPFHSGATVHAEGDHLIEIAAVDLAGNTATRAVRFTIDRTPPAAATHDFPADGSWIDHDATIHFHGVDPGDRTWYRLDDGPKIFSEHVTVSAEGRHTLVLGVTDPAGNETIRTLSIRIDRSAPSVAALTPPDGAADVSPASVVSVVVRDAASGIAPSSIEVLFNGTPAPFTYDPDTGRVALVRNAPLPAGANHMEVVVEDRAGQRTRIIWNFNVASDHAAAAEYVLFAAAPDGELTIAGRTHSIRGNVHSNGDLVLSGRGIRVSGNATARGRIRISARANRVSPQAAAGPPQPLPEFVLAEFAERADFVHSGDLRVRNAADLPPGIHYVRGNVTIDRPVRAHTTIAAEGSIRITTNSLLLEAYDESSHVLLFAGGPRIRISGNNLRLSGTIYAPHGDIVVAGRANRIQGNLWARTISINGADNRFTGLLPGAASVPSVVEFRVDRGSVIPLDDWSGSVQVLYVGLSLPDRAVAAAIRTGKTLRKPWGDIRRPDNPLPTDSEPPPFCFRPVSRAGSAISVEARSWQRTLRGRRVRWRLLHRVDSRHHRDSVRLLRNGDPFPNAFLAAEPPPTALDPFVQNGIARLAANQVLFLFELDARSTDSPAYDFRDLALLITVTPPRTGD